MASCRWVLASPCILSFFLFGFFYSVFIFPRHDSFPFFSLTLSYLLVNMCCSCEWVDYRTANRSCYESHTDSFSPFFWHYSFAFYFFFFFRKISLFPFFPNPGLIFAPSLSLQFRFAFNSSGFSWRPHTHSYSEVPVPGNFQRLHCAGMRPQFLTKLGQRDLCVCCPTALSTLRAGKD